MINKNVIAKFILVIFLIVLFHNNTIAQNKAKEETDLQIEKYKKEAEGLISYMEMVFNMLGDPETSNKDKDIIVNQSFLKIFENEKTQIQDDLDERRGTLVNKDVQAYLKDIDFFFTDVKFKFDINEITHAFNDKDQIYLLATLNRNLTGTTVKNKKINSNQVRYIEINIDDKNSDIRIASIYTEKLNEAEDLQNWWKGLENPWKDFFGAEIKLNDTLSLNQIQSFCDSTVIHQNNDTIDYSIKKLNRILKNISQTTELDLSKHEELYKIEALSKLTGLTSLNISGLKVRELLPIRSLTKLKTLNCSHTFISKLEAIKYATNLETLILNRTQIDSLTDIAHFEKLEVLYFENTRVMDISVLAGITSLKDLNMTGNKISDISIVKNFTNLEKINISRTQVKDINALSSLSKIEELKCEGTQVADLSPLNDNSGMKKIFCDGSGISPVMAEDFMNKIPDCLVVYRSQNLLNWWNGLSNAWKKILNAIIKTEPLPTNEELHRLANIEQLDFSGNRAVTTAKPLSAMLHLKKLNAAKCGIKNIGALQGLNRLEEINFSGCAISDADPLKSLQNLRVIDLSETQIKSINPLSELKHLEKLYIDQTPAAQNEGSIKLFVNRNPVPLVVYKSLKLAQWWGDLDKEWKIIFSGKKGKKETMTTEELHELIKSETITFPPTLKKKKIKNADALMELWRLKVLDLSTSGVSNLTPLSALTQLEELDISETPVSNLRPLVKLLGLKRLRFARTQINRLDDIAKLSELTELDCSGTKIRNIKPLSSLRKLKELDCSSTKVGSLKPISSLKLESLKCFNTKIWERQVDDYKESHPNCEVVYY